MNRIGRIKDFSSKATYSCHYKKSLIGAKGLLFYISLLLLYGCENAIQDMYDQPKHEPFEKSEFFPNNQSAQPLVDNTIVSTSGGFASSSSGRVGRSEVYPLEEGKGASPNGFPFPLNLPILQRGQERYNIYCSPCHGVLGDGDGIVVRRGFPSPPSYHSERLRKVPDSHFYNVMTQGFGRMFSYADRVKPQDRWAIIAYIRALQLSQNTQLADISADKRHQLLNAK